MESNAAGSKRDVSLALAAIFGPLLLLAIEETLQSYNLLSEIGWLSLNAFTLAGAIVGIAVYRAAHRPLRITSLGAIFVIGLFAFYGAMTTEVVYRHVAAAGYKVQLRGTQSFVIHGVARVGTRTFERQIVLKAAGTDFRRVQQSSTRPLEDFYSSSANQNRDCVDLEVLEGRFGLLLVRRVAVEPSDIRRDCRGFG